MAQSDQPEEFAGDDERLVELVDGVLVDPNLHTDMRMRLHREIAELVRTTHHELRAAGGQESDRDAVAAAGEHLPAMLEQVLVDPNLHTDQRMRLHREITEMLRAARAH